MRRLENKVAVVYGAGGIGSTIAKAFAHEGANVFLAGRTPAKLEAVAKEIRANGGSINIATLNALDEQAVDDHLNELISKAGKIDISFNAIGSPQKGVHNIPLLELTVENFLLPVTSYMQSHFLTVRAAASRMVKQGQGVILMHTPYASRVSPPFAGGLVPAWAAMEALGRSLSVECGKYGVRSVCLLTTAMPETPLIEELLKVRASALGVTVTQFRSGMEAMTHTQRLTTLEELANAAVFAASDESSAITGTILNLTAGIIAG
jgi:NAD(P)-dependent dehydrogenase (short-subunit alcohol dehydrogenase family)